MNVSRRRYMGAKGGSILPEGYTQLEYIENINNSYIDTGCQLDFTETIDCDIAVMDYTQYGYLFAEYDNDTSNCTRVILSVNAGYDLLSYYNTKASGGSEALAPCPYFDRINISLTPTGCYFNNVFYERTNFTQGTAYNGNMHILFRTNPAKARIYYFGISGKRNMIPCISPNNVVGMYDTIGNQFYSSLSNTAFVAGPIVRNITYQKIEYLQSDSDAYIDTGISGGDNNLGISGGFYYSTYENYGSIFSNYKDSSSNSTRILFSNVAGKYQYAVNSKIGNVLSGFDVSKKIGFYVTKSHAESFCNGTFTANTQSSSTGNTNDNNILLYALPSTGGSLVHRDIGLRIYSFTIRNSTTTLRDFVPVRIGNVGYMYDKVSGQLFGNAGTSDFILGPDIT